jgi:diadenylate cyclase
LSFRKIGALIVFPRITGLKNIIEYGQEIDAVVSKELLESIFNTKSPLHDGAVLIKNDRITYAGCFLPLSTNPDISSKLGTRHRAAIGITEETDAISLIVSEETGNISIGVNGKLTRNLDSDALKKVLVNLLIGTKDIKKK